MLCVCCAASSPSQFVSEKMYEALFVCLVVQEVLLLGLDDHFTSKVYGQTRAGSCSSLLCGIFSCGFIFVAIKKNDSSSIFLCHISDINMTHTIICGTSWPGNQIEQRAAIKDILDLVSTRLTLFFIYRLPQNINKDCLIGLQGKG